MSGRLTVTADELLTAASTLRGAEDLLAGDDSAVSAADTGSPALSAALERFAFQAQALSQAMSGIIGECVERTSAAGGAYAYTEAVNIPTGKV